MKLRLFRGSGWWLRRDQPGVIRGSHRKVGHIQQRARTVPAAAQDPGPVSPPDPGQLARQRQPHAPAQGMARAAIRIAPRPTGQAAAGQAAAGQAASGRAASGRAAPGQAVRAAVARDTAASGHAAALRPAAGTQSAQPWYATARPSQAAAGRRNCGLLEKVLIREWAEDEEPSAQAVTAVNRLAALPLLVKEKLAVGLDAIHVGAGGVPDLDDMGELKGVPLPSGRATWDACAGAYGDRKIVVGSRPSPTPDVMCHEVGHALDDIDGAGGQWQSDSAGFRALYERCLPYIASEFHRHVESVGRREFFADAFAAIASSQRPALVEMLSGDTRTALDVMLYFNVRYGM